MRISRGETDITEATHRGRARAAGHESGVVMMFVLMAILVVGAITLTVIQLINADVGGGLRELQAEQVFNISQAGVHYAIGKLQLAGANSYGGETITITSGSSTLGTATITVNCIDTGAAPPCNGNYAGYRRIVSAGALSGPGPSRTIVAVVQGTQGGTGGICGYANGVVGGGGNTIYSDVGSNTTITLASGDQIKADTNVPPTFTGRAVANGVITCATSCASQVQGGVFASQPGTICPALTVPAFTPGGSNLSVPTTGFTINSTSGLSWNDVSVAAGTCSGGTPYTDLMLQADPSNPNTVTVVQMNTLTMGACSRLVILGVGQIELRLAKAGHNSLLVNANSRFGVLPADTQSTRAPVPVKRLVVWVNANGTAGATTAVQFLNTELVSATIFAPNGRVFPSQVPYMYGAIWAKWVAFNSGVTFWSDLSGLPASVVSPYANFSYLRSWKDQ
jgi:hypothetical protein